MTTKKIKVLVAEDSEVVRMLLVHLLETDPGIQVVGQVADGRSAVNFVQTTPPDAVLMDIHMPRMNGFEATRRIMETQPVPIIVCSATADTGDMVVAFQAMEAGAIACIEKPLGSAWGDDQAKAAHLVETVRLMSEVKVFRRTALAGGSDKMRAVRLPPRVAAPISAVGIGASTGGPTVLQTILAGLSSSFAAPILVVQHLTPGFLPGLAAWLTETTGLVVEIARDGVYAVPGHVYLAPDDFHMGVSAGGTIVLSRSDHENHVRPAVSFMFRSLTKVYGPNVVGVLLTGMGRDGAEELRTMKSHGATTIAQDEASSVVHGMPGAAIALGAATLVLPSGQVADTLMALVGLHPAAVRS